jgi:hypothetical protein
LFVTTTSEMANRPGRSAKRRFHELRIANLRRQWFIWCAFLTVIVVGILLMFFVGRTGLAVGGWMLGFATAIAIVGWTIAFDVRALPWLWGSWGEEQTGEELARLGNGWFVRHDVANGYGNWDHIAVGPAGVFMIETKRLTGRIAVTDDGLSSGRTRFAGKTFRGASVGLREALSKNVRSCPWVQSVVAVWGDFHGEVLEREKVVYISGGNLVEWLSHQPTKLDSSSREALVQAVQQL